MWGDLALMCGVAPMNFVSFKVVKMLANISAAAFS